MLVQIIFSHDLICHCNSQWLHWVSVGVVISSDHLVEIVDHVLLRTHLNIITLQTKIIYSQLYNLMDQDDFNDFESAPAQDVPKTINIDELGLSVHSQPLEPPHNTLDLLKDLSLQPSFSDITNPPSEGSREIDNNDWYKASQAPLVKMESQMVSTMEPKGLNFSKTHSQTDFQSKPAEIHFDYLSLGDFKASQEKPASAVDISPEVFTSLLPKEEKKPQEVTEDFNFDTVGAQPQIAETPTIQIQPQFSVGNQDLLWDARIIEDKQKSQVNNQAILINEARKEPQFVFQSEEHKKEEQSISLPLSQLAYHSRPEEADHWTLKASADPIIRQEQIDPRKESEQFVFQDIKQTPKAEEQFIADQIIQPRKESDDFVFQAVTQSNEVQPQQSISSSIEPQTSQNIETDFISQRQEPHQQEPKETQEAFSRVTEQKENLQQQQRKTVQNNLNRQEQQDDEFGQFQQTVETVQPSTPANNYQIQQQNKVQIVAEKTPYGMNVPSRAQELQAFVNSLPNYSFILAQAFNSL